VWRARCNHRKRSEKLAHPDLLDVLEARVVKRQIDEIDGKILFELTEDARSSHAEIAHKVNLSRNAVRQRIERLERDKVIAGYTIRRGQALASSRIAAIIFVYRHDRMRGADVLSTLKRIPEIESCDVMSGEFDLVLRVEATEPDRIRQIWQQIAALDGVRDTVTSFVLSSVIAPN